MEQEVIEGVRRGDRQAMEKLYTKNKGLLYSLARRYRGACARDRSVDGGDLLQAGFLGLVAAARAWEPERGEWGTLAAMYIKKAMRETLGIRSTRIKAEHGAVSLDEPLPGIEDESVSRLDALEDTSLPEIDRGVLSYDLQRQVRAAVEGISDAKAQHVVQHCDLEGRTYRQVSGDMGLSMERVRQLRVKGHRELKSDPRFRKLAEAYALDYRSRFYQHVGVRAFKTTWTSATERVALWRLEQRDRMG